MPQKTYAFIDVLNTLNTVEKLLSFTIDWVKLYQHLEGKWKCEKIFFYSGIDIGDVDTQQEYEDLKQVGYVVRSKTIMSYKRKDKRIVFKCTDCNCENLQIIPMGYQKKSNCDVELSVDAITLVEPNSRILLFTGDGDFEYLARYLIEKMKHSVYIISNTSKSPTQDRRFSSRFKDLLNKGHLKFIDIKSWKNIIKKEI